MVSEDCGGTTVVLISTRSVESDGVLVGEGLLCVS